MTEKTNEKISGTKEWAEKNFNCSNGCANDCRYCYAKSMALRFRRKTKETWSNEEVYLSKAEEASRRRKPTTFMFPSTHDITPATLETCLESIKMVLQSKAGHNLLIVSKPDPVCIQRLCDELQQYKDGILFRFTVGSAKNSVLKFWEPNAPSFEDRLKSLRLAFNKGYETSVSCEPMLDNDIDTVIKAVSPFVTDAIWLGKANQLKARLSHNGETDKVVIAKAEELLNFQSDDNIRDLYNRYKDNPKIKWKESIKDVVGITRPSAAGLDI